MRHGALSRTNIAGNCSFCARGDVTEMTRLIAALFGLIEFMDILDNLIVSMRKRTLSVYYFRKKWRFLITLATCLL